MDMGASVHHTQGPTKTQLCLLSSMPDEYCIQYRRDTVSALSCSVICCESHERLIGCSSRMEKGKGTSPFLAQLIFSIQHMQLRLQEMIRNKNRKGKDDL